MAHHNHHHHHHHRKSVISPELAQASDLFDKFCGAATLKTILSNYRTLCEILHIKPTNFPQFYPKLKSKLCSWRAQALWNKFDKRANHKCYNRGKACSNTRVLIIGAGPCGLRAAIEAQLLGAKVVVIEKRDRMSRNNVLHLWPFVIQDLRALGAKKFFGKFCAGSIDHISIRQLQCILLKVALLLGVEIHEGVSFESLIPPSSQEEDEKTGWRAKVSPEDDPVAQYEFDVLIGADGKRNTLEGFKRKEFRGKLAIAITANFINHHSEAEARVEEISGVAYIFNQKFFKDLKQATGIDLENIVYYKDDTHYFVMTAKKTSLLNKGVILNDYADTAKLLALENINKEALKDYAKEAADFSTGYKLPQLQFAVNHYGQPDVAMFDFTSMYAAENASRVIQEKGYKLLMCLVGDSLLEPFWPTGSGCARGFLSSMDACWAIRSWGNSLSNPLEVIAERESVYRLLNQTTPENLSRDTANYTLDPHTRYPNLNTRSVLPIQVKSLYCCDDPSAVEMYLKPPSTILSDYSKKRRRKDSQIHHDILLSWLKKQVILYDNICIEDTNKSFKNGLALCAIIHRYRPDLIDFYSLNPSNVAENSQLSFDILEREFGILPVMTGIEMEKCEVPDNLTMLSYLTQVYDTFRGEIPYTHKKIEMDDDDAPVVSKIVNQNNSYKNAITKLTPSQKLSLLSRLSNSLPRKRYRESRSPTVASKGIDVQIPRKSKKRKSGSSAGLIDGRKNRFENTNVKMLNNMENNSNNYKGNYKNDHRLMAARILKSVNMLQQNSRQEKTDNENENEQFEDYSMFLYRQSAPDFKERVKDLEKKLLCRDRDIKGVQEFKKNPMEVNFSGRVKDIETKLKEGNKLEKKPKDLLRAIGKIEKTDWNVKEIEKKIEENKYGRAHQSTVTKVPKWNRQQFDDKFSAVKKKLIDRKSENNSKFAQIDDTLKRFEQKLRNGTTLEQGQRGANKVSAMAAQLTTLNQQPEEKLSKSGSRVIISNQGGSEICHFCNKRVYLMERLNAEGRFFHRGCFRCEYCGISLRMGNYSFDKEGKYGNRFYCVHHFGYPGVHRTKLKNKQNVNTEDVKGMNNLSRTPTVIHKYANDSTDTPERIEFENLEVDQEDTSNISRNEMDEDEWTDHNFGTSANELASSDDVSDISSEEEDIEDEFAQALDIPALDNNESLEYTRRYTGISLPSPASEPVRSKTILNDNNSCKSKAKEDSESSSEESVGNISYHEFESEDDESNTATAEEELKARELRMKEVRLEVPDRQNITDSGSDTEIASDDEYSVSFEEEEEDNDDDDDDSDEDEDDSEEDSATEISTDSEFERNNSTVIKSEIPDIIISESVSYKRAAAVNTEGIKAIHVTSKNIAEKSVPVIMKDNVKTTKSPSCSTSNEKNNEIIIERKANIKVPLVNPYRGDYYLSRTQSTEGVASKISLELKKKYLLGDNTNNLVKKSESTSVLDTKFKSLVDQISEHQKLLNPAPESSVSMQMFLDKTAVKLNSNSSPSTSPNTLANIKKSKELIGIGDFRHICNHSNDLTQQKSAVTNNATFDESSKISINNDDSDLKNLNASSCIKEERTASPIYETSIVVPDFPKKETGVEKMAELSSDDSFVDDGEEEEEEEEEEDYEGEEDNNSYHNNANAAQISLPKVEIHNSQGELLPNDVDDKNSSDIYKVNLVSSNCSNNNSINYSDKDDDNLNEYNKSINEDFRNSCEISDSTCTISNGNTVICQMPDVVLHSIHATEVNEKNRRGGDDDGDYINGRRVDESRESTTAITASSSTSKIMAMPVSSDRNCKDQNAQILKHVSTPAELFVSSKTETAAAKNSFSDKSSPSTPTSAPGDDNTLAVFTETELSDWARDEDSAVSENFDDLIMDTPNVTYRRHQKPRKRNNRGGANSNIKSSKVKTINDEYVHVCGKSEKVKPSSSFVLGDVGDLDIEFMDTGEDEEEDDNMNMEATNPLYVKNRGYIEYVTSEDEAKTPLAEAINSSFPQFSNNYPLRMCNTDSNVNIALAAKTGSMSHANVTLNNNTNDGISNNICNSSYHFDVNLNKSNSDIVKCENKNVVIVEDTKSDEYSRFVNKMQDKISSFGNAKDSINVRKLQQKIPKSPIKQTITTNGSEITSAPTTLPGGPSQKLEELSRERSKQKNLIHEMVMSKLQSEGKSIQDRKSRRSLRTSLSPLNPSSQNSLQIRVNDDVDNIKDDVKFIAYNSVEDNSQNKENINRDGRSYGQFSSLDISKNNRDQALEINDEWNTPSPISSDKCSESFSLPDIRKALNDVGDKLLTPVLPSTTRMDILKSTESIRQQARTRARLMSDSELGLSPEEKLKLLKQKIAARKAVQSAFYCNLNDYEDEEKNTYAAADKVLDVLQNTIAEMDSKTDNDARLSPKSKAIKEKERKKSIIQAVSDFFLKKSPTRTISSKDSPSPTKLKFKISLMGKEKSKSAEDIYFFLTESKNDKNAQLPEHAISRMKFASDCDLRKQTDCSTPIKSQLLPASSTLSTINKSDENLSIISGEGKENSTLSSTKQLRSSHRKTRRENQKKLRMAQEIQRQLEEIEVRQRELEYKGVNVEKELRTKNQNNESEIELMQELLDMIRERNELRKYEQKLLLKAKEIEAEEPH